MDYEEIKICGGMMIELNSLVLTLKTKIWMSIAQINIKDDVGGQIESK